jgi:hypothetical protein
MLFLENIVAHIMMTILMITSTKEDHLEIEIEMMSEGENMKIDEEEEVVAIEDDHITMTIEDLPLMRDDVMRIESHNRLPTMRENSPPIWMINGMIIEGETIMN